MNLKNLSERKRKILSAVVHESIENAEPVSSGKIQEQYMQNVSSATIRNELMSLESLGLLYQPHTSAGRIPTTEGYRYFVEEVLPSISPNPKTVQKLREDFSIKLSSVHDLVQKAASIISEQTNYASFAYAGVYDDATIQLIKLVKLTETEAVIVVKTDMGLITQVKPLPIKNTAENYLETASKFLNHAFAGRTLQEVSCEDETLNESFAEFADLFQLVLSVIQERNKNADEKLAVEGITNLFNYPEYQNQQKARQALSIMADKKKLYPVLTSGGDVEVSIKVNDASTGLEDCSVVTATYKVNGKTAGVAGVFGPVRMDYDTVVATLKGVTKVLTETLDAQNKPTPQSPNK